MKNIMDYKQSELDLIGSIGGFGVYFSVVTGLLFDYAGTDTHSESNGLNWSRREIEWMEIPII